VKWFIKFDLKESCFLLNKWNMCNAIGILVVWPQLYPVTCMWSMSSVVDCTLWCKNNVGKSEVESVYVIEYVRMGYLTYDLKYKASHSLFLWALGVTSSVTHGGSARNFHVVSVLERVMGAYWSVVYHTEQVVRICDKYLLFICNTIVKCGLWGKSDV
jgi:hypothetical protein